MLRPKHGKIGLDIFIYLIAAVLAALIYIGVSSVFFDLIGRSGESVACQTTAFLNAQTKTAGVEHISLKCPHTTVIVTAEMLNKELLKAKAQIRKYNAHSDPRRHYKYLLVTEKAAKTDDAFARIYNLNKIIANEQYNCFKKLGQGQLDLFENPYLFSVDEAKVKKKLLELSDRLNAEKYYEAAASLVSSEITENPRYCVLCSVIRFDKAAKELLLKDYNTLALAAGHEPAEPRKVESRLYYGSLLYFLQRNAAPSTERTYLEYLMDDNLRDMFNAQDTIRDEDLEPHFRYYIDLEDPYDDYSVLYVHTNMYMLQWLVNKAGGVESINDALVISYFGGPLAGLIKLALAEKEQEKEFYAKLELARFVDMGSYCKHIEGISG